MIDRRTTQRIRPSKINSSRLRRRSHQGAQADQHPRYFHHDKSELKGTERNVSQNRGAESIENVVGRFARIHPVQLMTGVTDQNQQSSYEGKRLARDRNVHGELLYGGMEAKALDNFGNRRSQGSINRTPAGALVTASPEGFGNLRYIELAFAAEAHAEAAVGQLAKK